MLFNKTRLRQDFERPHRSMPNWRCCLDRCFCSFWRKLSAYRCVRSDGDAKIAGTNGGQENIYVLVCVRACVRHKLSYVCNICKRVELLSLGCQSTGTCTDCIVKRMAAELKRVNAENDPRHRADCQTGLSREALCQERGHPNYPAAVLLDFIAVFGARLKGGEIVFMYLPCRTCPGRR